MEENKLLTTIKYLFKNASIKVLSNLESFKTNKMFTKLRHTILERSDHENKILF